ncbi:flagellar basal body rod protein FlgB [Maritalea mediterranea]|uniref:Flagellar basal body rod protein FlgB n=1 Tax=Maritalea mediterranea TaxID=2909667 RepID=A0ABS9EAL0_9HYPH|nr:flagellar basal body rod protein FlgB [Maritalea mediterranea]MCF4098805.1 flagellar basal body rod protein FlgB [Maritalea mediterranea]
MTIAKLPLFDALTQKMKWHQTRQTLLAENIANADTPDYRGRDLKQFDFAQHQRDLKMSTVSTRVTNARHISVVGQGADGFGPRQMNNFEITPEGNGVVLEDEMMKVSSNQMDYQAATAVYKRSLRLIRTALGKQ